MGVINEFKEFAVKGNVVDMATGVIIGTAFGKIVSSFVTDVVISYGKFIQTVVDFTIIAAVIFVVIKGINTLKKKAEAVPATPVAPPPQEILLTEIRDLLKK